MLSRSQTLKQFGSIRMYRAKYTSCVAGCALMLLSFAASAACDPQNVKHMPCPAKTGSNSTSTSVGPHPTGYTQTAHKPATYTAVKKPAVGPTPPGPLHATSSSTASNAIAAPSKGKPALVNPHSVSGAPGSSKAALNPQPIPPGHPLSPKTPKWDLTKNKKS